MLELWIGGFGDHWIEWVGGDSDVGTPDYLARRLIRCASFAEGESRTLAAFISFSSKANRRCSKVQAA